MSNRLVSIIIPTYNRAHLIGETLASVLAQTYTNWECIVVDDGSTDTTEALMSKYCSKDSRFKYYKRPIDKPKGANACRNYGFEMSKGDYVQWFDSDDIMHDSLLKLKMNYFFNNTDSDFVVCGFNIVNNKGGYEECYIKPSENYLFSYINDEFSLNGQNILWKKSAIKPYVWDETIHKYQDLDYLFEVLKTNSIKGNSINNILVEIRQFGDNISSNQRSEINRHRLLVRRRMCNYAKCHYNEKMVLRFYNLYLYEIKILIGLRNFQVCINELLKSDIIPISHKFIFMKHLFLYLIFKKGLNRLVKFIVRVSI